MSTDAIHDTAQRFYTLLHSVEESSREEAEQLLPVALRRVDQYRAIVAELRQLEAAAHTELARWEQTAATPARSVDPESPQAQDGLRGQAIAAKAAEVFRADGITGAVHYRVILQQLIVNGYRIPTAEPQASLLTALQRSDEWESIGGRSGLWKLADE